MSPLLPLHRGVNEAVRFYRGFARIKYKFTHVNPFPKKVSCLS